MFIKGLLENVGTDIEPLRLIKRIPNKMEIPDLKQALLKILQDYHLQVNYFYNSSIGKSKSNILQLQLTFKLLKKNKMSLRQGCEKILVSDSVQLADRMHKTQKRGIQCQGMYDQWVFVFQKHVADV